MTETTTYDYTPVDASDPILPVDTRPRTVVKTLNNIECERTYYVYSPLTNIVERVGTQGAPYGGTNVLRTVTIFYPVTGGPLSSAAVGNGESGIGNGEPVGGDHRAPRSGFVQSIRHEDGTLDLYDYSLSSNCWIRTVTHLHEQSPSPVSGKTTRDITTTNSRGEILEQKTDAYIDGIWYTIARNTMTYNPQGKRITSENLAGQVTTTAWNQYVCNPVDELIPGAKLGGPGSVPAAGDTTTWLCDDGGLMIASSRLCGRHRKPNSFFALLHFAADGEGHDRKNRSGQPEIAQTGVQAGMSYCINPTVSISSDPSLLDPHAKDIKYDKPCDYFCFPCSGIDADKP